jgi:peptidoglycan-associated lipoprotein
MAPARLASAAALLLAGSTLAGCLTAHENPQVSRAVLDARAHLDAPAAADCPQTTLQAISPLSVGFAFNETALPDLIGAPLPAAPRWLSCHPQTPVVIKPDADNHGADAERDVIARKRGEAVRDYLVANGVAAERIRLLPRDAAEPAGEHLLVLAEGRRW